MARDEVIIDLKGVSLRAYLNVPRDPIGIVLFAHGTGSGRKSPRNQLVAKALQDENIATLLLDLLTEEEEKVDEQTAQLRFDIPFLAKRLLEATRWIEQHEKTKELTIGYFGASTGAAAALIAAAEQGEKISAVVSRGGRPDLAAAALPRVLAPTLLIVGGEDYAVLDLNKQAFERLACEKKLEIIPNATHLFEEPGALEEVGRLSQHWFSQYL